MAPQLVPLEHRSGELAWMIRTDAFPTGLYLYTDSIEELGIPTRGDADAMIRPFNALHCPERPRSAPIPVGSRRRGGFPRLTRQARAHIDLAFDDLGALIQKHAYTHIIFSAHHGKLESPLYYVGREVQSYIMDKLEQLANSPS